MYFTNVEYLHHHSNKPAFVKIIFSAIASIVLLFLIQPIWIYDLEIIPSDKEDEKTNYKIKKTNKWFAILLLLLLCTILIYNFILY
jgi:Na+/melibiose symporter-like transporter